MQTNLLWTGREYHSLENCILNTGAMGSEAQSIIIGTYDNKIYQVEYRIRTNENWQTIYCEVQSRHSDQRAHVILESDGRGNWTLDGKTQYQFQGCMDVDIPLTPFTNTLPIKRLSLRNGDEHEIKVIYLDLLKGQIVPVSQKYIRLSDSEYHYQNVPNDFEAKIAVDELGLVVDYPRLFALTAKLESRYH